MPRPRRRNPWSSTGEVLLWLLFTALLFPAAFAGWAVGHYTSLGNSTVVHTVTVGKTSAGTTTSAPATTAATTTSGGATTSGNGKSKGGSGGGNAEAGKAVFAANGCAACHTFQPAGSSGTIGPNLDSAPASDAKADNNMDLSSFVKESIEDPDAYIAKGYSKGIMPTNFGSKLSSTDLADLVAFIVSGSSG